MFGKCLIGVGIIRIIRIDTSTGSPLLHSHTWRAAVDTFVKPVKFVIIVRLHSVNAFTLLASWSNCSNGWWTGVKRWAIFGMKSKRDWPNGFQIIHFACGLNLWISSLPIPTGCGWHVQTTFSGSGLSKTSVKQSALNCRSWRASRCNWILKSLHWIPCPKSPWTLRSSYRCPV